MTTVGQRDDKISDLLNEICDWAGEHPEKFKCPEDAAIQALRNFVIQNKIRPGAEDEGCWLCNGERKVKNMLDEVHPCPVCVKLEE